MGIFLMPYTENEIFEVAASRKSAEVPAASKPSEPAQNAAAKTAKGRKLSFKEQRELEGIEAEIHKVDLPEINAVH